MALNREISAFAAEQHGLITVSQLLSIGVGRSSISDRARMGILHRIQPGVYAVGHPKITEKGRWLAAVLACGPDAQLSHHSAAALHGLRPTSARLIDVTTTTGRGRKSGSIRRHRSRTLTRWDRTHVDGIPCTSIARTLLDLAAEISEESLSKAIERAEILKIYDRRSVDRLLARAGRHRGVAALRKATTNPAQNLGTRSVLERRFLKLCNAAGVEIPLVNRRIQVNGNPYEADFLWPSHGLVVETDGFATHGTRRAYERDKRRDQDFLIAGFRVARFSYRHITDDPEDVIARLQQLLGYPA